MRVLLALALALLLASAHGLAERAASPADATVFIRLTGSAHIDIENAGTRRSVDLERVEIGTGSGFLFSPTGYVLTNHHVVHDPEAFILSRGGVKATVTLSIQRIDVCFQPEAMTARALSTSCSAASVVASDAAMDLAVLFIGGSDLPYVALGDSDAARTGLPVDALGYPFGRDVEVGKDVNAADLVPEVSTTPGAISARRSDDAGEQRYLQVTNTLNPGNSGGPLITREGFAVGVICMKLTRGAGIGFAIPINRVKDFLESNGLDQFLPVRRLRLGGLQDLGAKGIRLRMVEGFADASRFRMHVASDPQASDVALRIDRVVSPWSSKRLEEALVGTSSFEADAMAPAEGRVDRRGADARLLLGRAVGEAPGTGQETWMDYGILDLGAEKLVARYVGSAEAMALNESVLRESLRSLQGRRLQAAAPERVESIGWSGAANAVGVPLPAGWVLEPGRPSPCQGLPQPAAFTSAAAPRDLAAVLRAARWTGGGVEPRTAAAACSGSRGSLGDPSYRIRDDWLGVTYVIEGVFLQLGSGETVHLEVASPEEHAAYGAQLLSAWAKMIPR